MKKGLMSVVLASSVLIFPAVSGAALGDQTLRTGSNHADVEELQDVLRDTGHYASSSTGNFDSATKQAVRSFQSSKGILVDGIVGPQTFRSLGVSDSGGSSVSASSSTVNFSGTLRYGSRGSGVRSLQSALNSSGANAGSVDGVFGSQTRSAVQSFQRSAGISVDGVAGPQTFDALGGSVSSSGSSSASKSNSKSGSTGSVSSNSSGSSSSASGVISTAKGQIGSPYSWGGTSPSGFDCSGFLNYAFSKNGQSIPRTVSAIHGAATSVSNPQVGDIVFFATTHSGPSHAGIYLGNNEFIHAGSSTGVTVSNLNTSYWSNSYLGAGRL
ncbi:peptidase [Salipaludibacillus neizhouensis]|uniref:Peptidase n=1 Tax=Salipaludibacillus neizhouensis TaxID=885475 RepID=A0A3A9KD62_9BACI|nr:peptidoglycan-binding protein [Salipaludibacillus neizhouensis]RKL68451.1 peptidase [Salipaludibacillus neizhouensis]